MALPYLIKNAPARSQFRSPRRSRPSGLTVLHTAESVMDTVGPDTGAENVANFIRTRREAGSYHDLVDSDSALQLVRYGDEAYHDGTGSNAWSLSISWALAAADWPKLTAERRDAFLRQGAVAFRRQQAWLTSHDYPTTPLRRLTKAQSDAGLAGFIKHGDRDPGRRSDPGMRFPWERWFELCAPTPAPPAAPTPPLTYTEVNVPKLPQLQVGSRGEDVQTLQSLLVARRPALHAKLARTPSALAAWVDGILGDGTAKVLREFQNDADVPVTGKTDAATWAKLLRVRE